MSVDVLLSTSTLTGTGSFLWKNVSCGAGGGGFTYGTGLVINSTTTTSYTVPTVNTTGDATLGGSLSVPVNLSVTGTQQYPSPSATSIAGLPTCNAAAKGLTGWEVTNQTSPATWGATPVATASPVINYPVRCWSDGAWHISN